MLSRVTMQTTSAAAQRGLQANASKLAEAQQRAQELQKNLRISDDPTAAADSMAVRGQQAAADQYGRNIVDGNNWLTLADNALGLSKSLMDRVQSLTLQAANGTMNAQSREAIAVEIDSIRSDMLGQANTQYLGRNIFAGNSDAGVAFVDGAPPTFTGSGSTVQRRIGADATIQVDANGAKIFGEGADSIFGLLSKISGDLRSGADISNNITSVNAAVDTLIGARAEVGARQAELLRAKDSNATTVVNLENQRSGIEDMDLGKAILALQTQQLAYQASLGVTAKVIQPTLMDFLR